MKLFKVMFKTKGQGIQPSFQTKSKKVGSSQGRVRACLNTLSLALALAAMGAIPVIPHAAHAKKGGKGGGGDSGGFIAACVAFRDANEGLDIDRIRSDDGNAYCHDKRAKIQAEINTSGGFRFDTGGRRGTRQVWLDFSLQALPGDEGSGDLVPLAGRYAADIRIHDEYRPVGPGWESFGQLNLVDMPAGSSTYVGLSSGPLIKFDPFPPGPFDTGIADPVAVTRLDDFTWVFESLPEGVAASFKIVDNDWDNPVYLGSFSMPFEMTVTILP